MIQQNKKQELKQMTMTTHMTMFLLFLSISDIEFFHKMNSHCYNKSDNFTFKQINATNSVQYENLIKYDRQFKTFVDSIWIITLHTYFGFKLLMGLKQTAQR